MRISCFFLFIFADIWFSFERFGAGFVVWSDLFSLKGLLNPNCSSVFLGKKETFKDFQLSLAVLFRPKRFLWLRRAYLTATKA